MGEEFSVLGKRLPRADAVAKVTGKAKFMRNIYLPRMLELRFLRSPYAHAKIVKIDTSKAEAFPGVKAILTYRNVPLAHPRGKLEYLLNETVRYCGDEVAAIAAVDRDTANEALKLIEVEYEVLPAVFDTEEAMQPGAPLVHAEYGTNMFHGSNDQLIPRCRPDGWLPIDIGDVEKGFAEADYILEGAFQTPTQYHCSPSPRSVIAQWTGEELTVWCDTQLAYYLHEDLSRSLGIPLSKIRCISSTCVGGYGGKEPEKVATLAAIAAKRTGRPVRAIYTREEDITSTRVRASYKAWEKVGLKKDGRIAAVSHRMISNFGSDNPYAFEDLGAGAIQTCSTLYEYETVRWRGANVMTNTVEAIGMVAFGDTPQAFAVERFMDEAAEKTGMDPVEFRLKNCTRYGDRAQTLYTAMGLARHGVPLPSTEIEWGVMGTDMDSLQEGLRQVRAKSGWKEKWQGWRTPVEINGAKRKGIGVAMGIHNTIYAPYAATVKMNHDGTATVLSSGTDIGEGFETAICQVVAEALGLRYEDVTAVLSDTAVTPAGVGIFGSIGTSSGVAAGMHAANDAKRQLFEIAAKRLGVSPNDLEAKDRMVYVKGERAEGGIPIAQLCLMGYQVTGNAVNPSRETIRDKKSGKIIYSLCSVATIIEVEVDTETGGLTVLRITSAHDCGKAINPTIVENQIAMAVTVGNGFARSEEYIIDQKTGVLLNPNLLDYKIMTFLDMPKMKDFDKTIIEFPCAWGPFGAKGMSETGSIAAAPAIANAVYNAIGVRIRGDHLTPPRILEALGKVPRR
ncbi:MAG: xanthine dehydrogenase family protein molybdopterin-binding subunit [Chloroflexi bacterium]|nr:xanthine dehydrogenase family protein molybdopterin-binding subunit [Chloroflexota bacterium]